MSRRARASVASFDSATAMTRASARFLRGRDVPGAGLLAPPLARLAPFVAPALNHLPPAARAEVYRRTGASEAVPARRAWTVSSEAVARWLVRDHPRRRFPAVVIGSSSGALVHLCALWRVPWLPQTVLVPVRQPGLHVDEPRDHLEALREPARGLLDANPDWQLHHMHDPSHDRLMLARMTYFRVKWRRLPAPYRAYLEEVLAPDGLIVVSDCNLRWPATRVGERHLFQFGAYGGLGAEEFHRGSERVREFLAGQGSHRERWDPPTIDTQAPEAEWGLEPSLLDDLQALARTHRWRVVRLRFGDPEALSPAVARLHDALHRRRGLAVRRLLVDSFILLDPWWTLRTGSVPLWSAFAVESSARMVEQFIADDGPFDEIGIRLFQHGIASIGVPAVERWQSLAAAATSRGALLGVDAARHPSDLAALARSHRALRATSTRCPLPSAVPIDDGEQLLAAARGALAWERV